MLCCVTQMVVLVVVVLLALKLLAHWSVLASLPARVIGERRREERGEGRSVSSVP